MFICRSADVFIGQLSFRGASVTYAVWASETADAAAAAAAADAEPAWGGSVVVPTWIATPKLAGKTAELWFDAQHVRQVVFERVDRTLAFFRGIGPPPAPPSPPSLAFPDAQTRQRPNQVVNRAAAQPTLDGPAPPRPRNA